MRYTFGRLPLFNLITQPPTKSYWICRGERIKGRTNRQKYRHQDGDDWLPFTAMGLHAG